MAVRTSASSDPMINDLSSVIGELRNFAAQQSVTNTHMLEELKKISDRMSGFSEVGATFVEYRKTLHERFGKIHEQIASIDDNVEKLQDEVIVKLQKRTAELEQQISNWKSQWKIAVAVFSIASSVAGAILAHYGTAIVHNL